MPALGQQENQDDDHDQRADSDVHPVPPSPGVLPVREEYPVTGGDNRRQNFPKDGEGRNRTGDTTIFSRVLYQLSYLARQQDRAQPTCGAKAT